MALKKVRAAHPLGGRRGVMGGGGGDGRRGWCGANAPTKKLSQSHAQHHEYVHVYKEPRLRNSPRQHHCDNATTA